MKLKEIVIDLSKMYHTGGAIQKMLDIAIQNYIKTFGRDDAISYYIMRYIEREDVRAIAERANYNERTIRVKLHEAVKCLTIIIFSTECLSGVIEQIKKNTQNQDGQAGLDGTISKTELFPPEIPSLEDVTVPVDVNALIEELEQKTNQNNN